MVDLLLRGTHCWGLLQQFQPSDISTHTESSGCIGIGLVHDVEIGYVSDVRNDFNRVTLLCGIRWCDIWNRTSSVGRLVGRSVDRSVGRLLTPLPSCRWRSLLSFSLESWLVMPLAYQGMSSPNITDGDAPNCRVRVIYQQQ